MSRSTYIPEFQLQVVLEALQSDGTDVEIAQPYDIHPVTLSNWKKKIKENSSKAYIPERMDICRLPCRDGCSEFFWC